MALLHVMQFAAQNVTSVNPTYTTLYTVPAGDRIVIRSVQVRNLSGTAAMTAYLRVNTFLIDSLVMTVGGTAGSSVEHRPWWVCAPGDVISMAASVATGYGLILSGSLYTI
jgi:hypothetical protein